MSPFTVISYYTPKFECFAKGLEQDCERFGYRLHCEGVEREFDNLIQAFDFKITFIRNMLKRYPQVLWLDIECRIVKPIPPCWTSPLISVYETGKSQGFSSGVLMLDDTKLDFIDLWMKYAAKYPQYPDDFVLDFLARSISIDFDTIPLEFYDRQTSHLIARGLWENENTVVQHPTINRWPDPMQYRKAFNGRKLKHRTESESISRQRKGIYYRNFGGNFEQIHGIMKAGIETEYCDSGWIFDAVQQLYAPELFWPAYADDYTTKPRSFERSMHNFKKKPKGDSFRTKAMRKMRLDRDDAKRFGAKSSFIRSIFPWR
ncbi:MAG: hypothetical protein P8L85_01760 [Rubripirellula sp.]|nr:hypothetical protein [Rubripirellula sp.]